MPHIIRLFDKLDESYAGEMPIPYIPVTLLQSIFGVNSDNPMYDCYPISNAELERMNAECGCDLDLDFSRFDYFLEYYRPS